MMTTEMQSRVRDDDDAAFLKGGDRDGHGLGRVKKQSNERKELIKSNIPTPLSIMLHILSKRGWRLGMFLHFYQGGLRTFHLVFGNL